MQERFTVSEAARVLEVSRQTLYTWLSLEPEIKRQLDKHHTLTRAQLDTLRQHRQRPPRAKVLDLHAVDSALSERLEALEDDMRAVKDRLTAIEKMLTDS